MNKKPFPLRIIGAVRWLLASSALEEEPLDRGEGRRRGGIGLMNWVLSSERLVEEPHFSSTQTASFLEKVIPAILTADHLKEEPDIPEAESRFGRHGFWGWFFSADRLDLEPVPGINEKPVSRSYDLMSIFSQEEIVEQPVGTQPLPATGIRNMRSWLLSADPLEEEYAAGKSSTRFGETGFTRWLFKSDPLQEE